MLFSVLTVLVCGMKHLSDILQSGLDEPYEIETAVFDCPLVGVPISSAAFILGRFL
jgi:hypothetical protein